MTIMLAKRQYYLTTFSRYSSNFKKLGEQLMTF